MPSVAMHTPTPQRLPIPLPAPVPMRPQPRPGATQEDFLRLLPFLNGASDGLVRSLGTVLRRVRLERGARLYWEGEDPSTVYIVRSGWVKLMRGTSCGRSVLFDVLGPGDLVGALGLLDQGCHATAAVSASDTELYAVSRRDFLGLARRYPELWYALSREIGHQLRNTFDARTDMVLGVEGRTAGLFLRLAEQMGAREGTKIHIPKLLTRRELAGMVGSTTETVIRVLSRWKKRGLVSTNKDSFVIESLEKLIPLAQQAGRTREPMLPMDIGRAAGF